MRVQVGYADGWCWGVLGVFRGVLGVLGKADFKDAGCWLEPFRVQVGYADGWCWGVLAGLGGLSGSCGRLGPFRCRLVTLMVGVGGSWGSLGGSWGVLGKADFKDAG